MVEGLAGRAISREPLDHLISVPATRATEQGTLPGGFMVLIDPEFEDIGPVARLGEGFECLALAGGDNDPGSAGISEAIEDCLGGGGVVFTGLAGPEADFEASCVRCKSGLVGQEFEGVEEMHVRGKGLGVRIRFKVG